MNLWPGMRASGAGLLPGRIRGFHGHERYTALVQIADNRTAPLEGMVSLRFLQALLALAHLLLKRDTAPRKAATDAAHSATAPADRVDSLSPRSLQHTSKPAQVLQSYRACHTPDHTPGPIRRPRALTGVLMRDLPSVAQNLADLRAWRDAHAAKFNHDTAAIFRDIQRMDAEANRDRVTLPPELVASSKQACPACGRQPGHNL